MIDQYVLKEANRYYWIVKGHLIPESWGEDQITAIYKSYFDRIWGNHENVVHEEGFEEAWKARVLKCAELTKKQGRVRDVEDPLFK